MVNGGHPKPTTIQHCGQAILYTEDFGWLLTPSYLLIPNLYQSKKWDPDLGAGIDHHGLVLVITMALGA